MSSRPSTASTSTPVGGHPASSMASVSGFSSDGGGLPSPEEELGDDEAHEQQQYLWEQISGSIDVVEREEIERVVGQRLVSACADVYAEVRALQDILKDYSADTDELVKKRSSMPRSMGSQPAGLVQLELKSLVAQLRKRAAAAGKPEDALLPMPSSPQRKALEQVLHGDDALGKAERPHTAAERPGTADSSRLSLRDMRLGARPGTASRPGTSSQHGGSLSASSRPGTSSAGGSSRPVTAMSASVGEGGGEAAGGSPRGQPGSSSRGAAAGSSRPASRSGRPGSAASDGSSADGSCCSERTSSSRGGGGSRGGLVVSRLRAALEEERQALLAQAEGLRLAIEDEHEYRNKVEEPPPSLTNLLDLKRSLQDMLARQTVLEVAPELGAAELAQARGRASLSRYAALPPAVHEGGGA